MSGFSQSLADCAAELGLSLDDGQLARFETYRELLQTWNRSFNLVADARDEAILHDHGVDSLAHLVAMRRLDPPPLASLVDVGAGAGLPGVLLKIAAPELRLVLVESNGKKSRFLDEVVRVLEWDDVEVLPERAEEVGRDPGQRERHGWTVARRLAELSVLLEYCLPLLAVGGWAVCAKGERAEREQVDAAGVEAMLGGGEPQLLTVPMPAASVAAGAPGERRFVAVRKIAPTPENFPRAPGRPAKRPLRAAG